MQTDSSTTAGNSVASAHTKYSFLPDVDITAPDLYETRKHREVHSTADASRRPGDAFDDATDTSDSAEESGEPFASVRKHKGSSSTNVHSADIDNNSVSVTSAAAKFGRATDINGERADFSGRLVSGRWKNAGNNANIKGPGLDSEVYTTDENRQSSVQERLRQLKYEAKLLEEEIASGEPTGSSSSRPYDSAAPHAVAAQLDALQKQLSALEARHPVEALEEASAHDYSSLLRHLSEPTKSQLAKSDDSAEGYQLPSASIDTAHLDARLSTLESLLGLQQVMQEADAVPRPLLSTLARMESQLALLSQPRHLDTISRRVKVLVAEMERVRDSRTDPRTKAADQTSTSSQVVKTTLAPSDLTQLEHLFQISKRLEPLLPIVLPVLDRLHTLRDLHESTANFKTSLDDVQAKTAAQHQQTTELNQLLKVMETNMQQNRATMQSNLESLQSRISDVSSTLQHLQ